MAIGGTKGMQWESIAIDLISVSNTHSKNLIDARLNDQRESSRISCHQTRIAGCLC